MGRNGKSVGQNPENAVKPVNAVKPENAVLLPKGSQSGPPLYYTERAGVCQCIFSFFVKKFKKQRRLADGARRFDGRRVVLFVGVPAVWLGSVTFPLGRAAI